MNTIKRICSFICILGIICTMNLIVADAKSQSDAVNWLKSQVGAEYKNKYGAQCVCFVTAYMNWCVTGNPNSGTYPTYNANQYPNIANSDPGNWEVIKNYLEFVPQAGDIFVSKGLDANYGHVGVVISSDVNNATIIDQNGVKASSSGSPAAIHNITWTKAYSPTYFIRYKGFSNSSASSSNVNFALDTSSNTINYTDVRLYSWLYKTPGLRVTNAGIYLWPETGSQPSSPTYSENFSAYDNYKSRDSVHINYTIGSGKEVNYKLNEGEKYSYKIYCVVEGKEYTTSVGTFTTKGTHKHSFNQFAYTSTQHPHYKSYKCECGAVNENKNEANFSETCEICLNTKTSNEHVQTNVNYNENFSYDDTSDEKNQFILTVGSKKAKVWGKNKRNDVAPKIVNSRTMLPARFVAENLGAEVEWDESDRIVTIYTDDIDIVITIGSKRAYVNGKKYTLDSEAFIENGRTYTPVRFIAEMLGAKVEWDSDNEEVIITR